MDISEYISEVNKIINKYSEDEIIVYRGEDTAFPEPCIPNIFRKMVLGKDLFFERNLLDGMRQNKLSEGVEYLQNAIDAQHGEFSSRLLDVTYNCLVALYFAITPFRTSDESQNDDKDGMVYIFHYSKIFNPFSKNTNDCYNNVIERKNELFSDSILFGKNHKLIDTCKTNNRIIAQQGAFILFQGDAAEPLPKYLYDSIKITKDSKANMRRELRILFGIHTGSIYPEITNLVNELSEKSKKNVAKAFSINAEFFDALEVLDEEFDYYLDKNLSVKGDIKDREIVARMTERMIFSYYLGVKQFIHRVEEKNTDNSRKYELENFIGEFKKRIEGYIELLKKYKIDNINLEDFMLLGEENEN